MKKQHKNYVLLGALQPSLESAYDYLSKGFPQGKAPAERDSHLARTSSLWTAQEFPKFVQRAGSFFSHYIGDSLGSSFTLSVTHATAAIVPQNSVPFQIFSSGIFQQGVNVS